MTHGTGQLLFDEPPIAVSPSLVRLLGLPEATLLQQVHFRIWCKRGDPAQYAAHFIDGRYWVHWSMAELQAAVPLGATSPDPYRRVIKRLRTEGILLVEQHRRSQWDRTNWYSIDYAALDAYVASHGGSGGGSIGGNSTSRGAALPSIDRRERTESIRGDSVPHSQSKTSSETSRKTTTTTSTDEPSEKRATGGGTPVDLRDLDLSALPSGMREDVEDLVRSRSDAQRFVDLLVARLARDGELPAAQKLKNPLLWLRRVIERGHAVDFCEADRLRSERRRQALLAAYEQARVDGERDARVQADEADRARRARAQSIIADMCAAELARLKARVLAGALPAAQRSRVAEAIDAGRLPDSPAVLYPTIRALEAIRQQQPGGAE